MSRNTEGRIPVTQDMLTELRQWQDKTGYGMTALFRYSELHSLFETTKSLNAPTFNNILTGKTRTVFPEDFKQVINTYQSLPPERWGKPHALSRQKERVPVTDEFKARLCDLLENTTLSRAMLLRLHGAPKDLSATKLGRILKRQNTTILKSHAEFLERVMARAEK